MNSSVPYISLVVTSRNDDHGGSLLRRTQTFVNSFLSQCRRHSLHAELIFVEWNPPPDRPPLRDALEWPGDLGPCLIRFIQVPPELHKHYKHASALPLYQMIGKNVGIRRAGGRFILATNIDILFSEELIGFLAARQLEPGKMYRVDRFDSMSEVPVEASIEQRLEYCRAHLLRVNEREGTFPLTPDGRRIAAASEAVNALPAVTGDSQSGIYFGPGWFAPEQHFGEVFRWAEADAHLVVIHPAGAARALAIEMEPGPSAGGGPLNIQIRTMENEPIGEVWLHNRTIVRLTLPVSPGQRLMFRLYSVGGGRAVPNDPRILNFRVFRCEWVEIPKPAADGTAVVQSSPVPVSGRISRRIEKLRRLWKSWRKGDGALRVGLPVSPRIIRKLGLRVDGSGISMSLDFLRRRQAQCLIRPGTNLLWGAGWHPVETYAGETFCWAVQDAEIIVQAPSGEPSHFSVLMEAGPGVGYRKCRIEIRDQFDRTLTVTRVGRRRWKPLSLPCRPGETHVFSFHVEGGGLPAPPETHDPRILNFRVLQCGWQEAAVVSVPSLQDAFVESDVARAGMGFIWGQGWGPVESEVATGSFRWAVNGAELILRAPESEPRVLRLELEPGQETPLALEICDAAQRPVAYGLLQGRQAVRLTLPMRPGRTHVFSLHAPSDGRSKMLRLFSLEWSEEAADIFELGGSLTAEAGWSAVQYDPDGYLYRQIEREADLLVKLPAGSSRTLQIDVSPTTAACAFEIQDVDGRVLTSSNSPDRHTIDLLLEGSPGARRPIRISTSTPLRVLHCGWHHEHNRNFKFEGTPSPTLDIFDRKDLTLGKGWHAPECAHGEVFRWITNDAEIILQKRPLGPLYLEIEGGPGLGDAISFSFQLRNAVGEAIYETTITGRQKLIVSLPAWAVVPGVYHLHIEGGGVPSTDDPRILNFRVFRSEAIFPSDLTDLFPLDAGIQLGEGWFPLEWGQGEVFRRAANGAALLIAEKPRGVLMLDVLPGAGGEGTIKLLDDSGHSLLSEASLQGRTRVEMAFPPWVTYPAVLRLHLNHATADQNANWHFQVFCSEMRSLTEAEIAFPNVAGVTLGRGWHPVRFEGGEAVRPVANNAEIAVDSRQIRPLCFDLAPGFAFVGQELKIQFTNHAGEVLQEFIVGGRQTIEVRVPMWDIVPNAYYLRVVGDDLPWIVLRVFRCWQDGELSTESATIAGPPPDVRPQNVAAANPVPPPQDPLTLHTNACGDFTLMAREHWFDVRGYAEFDMYSFNIDSLLCYTAHHAGAREHILEKSMRIYHIEHGLGSGWTPEGQAKLFERLTAKGIPYLDWSEAAAWAAQMRRLQCTMIFNQENWGLADFNLPETVIDGVQSAAV